MAARIERHEESKSGNMSKELHASAPAFGSGT
jgi:hypothetical protein